MKDHKRKKSLSTKTGDQGETSLFDGTRIPKSDPRPEAYGTLDEASAFLGLARAKTQETDLGAVLLEIQNRIYLVNAELACPPGSKSRLTRRFEEPHMKWVEEKASEIERGLALPPKFVLYGETETGALLDLARAVVRRAERHLVVLDQAEELGNPLIMPFVNRLSDLLYLLARRDERDAGKAFRHPEV